MRLMKFLKGKQLSSQRMVFHLLSMLMQLRAT
jgi:hypothetical protein